ncbi:MAG TPA: Rieske 2Fe-2S domain-containing protein [Nitrososphaeraceae archaeon]|nr:Rieske 2Fe-2S domain-containing protein [Nitrososphaeraceae archaeon]
MGSADNKENTNYTRVGNLKDFQEDSLIKIEIKGESIILPMVNGQIHAMDSVCSHQDVVREWNTRKILYNIPITLCCF